MTGVAKPTGEYADEMLESGGWVDLDEQSLHDRAQVLTATFRRVTSAIEGFQHQESEIFGGGMWSGGGADGARGKLGEVVNDLQGVQDDLVNAITWYQKVASTVEETKSAIHNRVVAAQADIDRLKKSADTSSDDGAQKLQDDIDALWTKLMRPMFPT